MKIIHWDEMFHPSFGYQINVLTKYQAMQGHEVIVFTSDKITKHPTFKSFGNDENIEELDKEFSRKYGVRIVRLPVIGHYSGRVLYKSGFIKRIKRERPDVLFVHTHDTFSGIYLTLFYNKLGIPMILDNHMLKMASRNKLKNIHRFLFRKIVSPTIIKKELVVIRTQDDDYVNECYGLPKELTPFISFGTDTTIFHPDRVARQSFREAHNIAENAFVIIYTGKLDSAKGGLLLANTLKKKFNTYKEVVIIIVGNTGKDEYGDMVEKVLNESENRILRFPTQKYCELASFYQASDLCLFAKQCSLSFFDAQACALPVVFEDNNINIERSSHENGWVFNSGDINDFRNKITIAINTPTEQYDQFRRNAEELAVGYYDYSIITEKYSEIILKEYYRQIKVLNNEKN